MILGFQFSDREYVVKGWEDGSEEDFLCLLGWTGDVTLSSCASADAF
jgi:hypothetical protein